MSGLPIRNISKKSDEDVTTYFDTYYTRSLNLADNDLNSIVAFFEKQGFDRSAALSVSNVLLGQAKAQNIKIYKLIDTLRSYQGNKLSSIVAEILNYDRKRTSVIGFKTKREKKTFESRNIIEGNPISTLIVNTNINDLSSTEITMDSEQQTLDGE